MKSEFQTIELRGPFKLSQKAKEINLPSNVEAFGVVEQPAEVEFTTDHHYSVGDHMRFSFQGIGNRLDGDWEIVKVCGKMITAVQRTKK